MPPPRGHYAIMLSDVCRVHPVGRRRVRPAGWRVLADRARLKAAAARFRCRPGRGSYRGVGSAPWALSHAYSKQEAGDTRPTGS